MGLVISVPASSSGSAQGSHLFEAEQPGLLWKDEFNSGSPDLGERGYTVVDHDWNTYTRVGDVDPRYIVNQLSVGQYRSTIKDSRLLIQTPQNVFVGIYINRPAGVPTEFTVSARHTNTNFPWTGGTAHQLVMVQNNVVAPVKLLDVPQERIDVGMIGSRFDINTVKGSTWASHAGTTIGSQGMCTSFIRVDGTSKQFQAFNYIDGHIRNANTAMMSHPNLNPVRVGFVIRQENTGVIGAWAALDYLRIEPFGFMYGRAVI